ncbi:head-tail joining protein [Haematobacter massiliensis]|uniref:head-tail joining protein n=1 Tax=Haematobacter massiliensis TaxID=195105 RepID=UPI0015950A38|nr:hypothetical protein [Haematobacter massiliensis]
MTSIFDGMASLIAGVLGRPDILYLPSSGVDRTVQSIFRETPVEAQNSEGVAVLITSPSWRVERHLVPEIARGDRIDPGNGKRYRVKTVWPSGSPAVDAAVLCELTEDI